MEADKLMAALSELEVKGWPLSTHIDGNCKRYALLKLALSNHYFFYPQKESALWVLEGWLRKQLEARGLRREVLAYPDYTGIIILDANRYELADEGASTELEALLKACLALPTAAQQPKGETTAPKESDE